MEYRPAKASEQNSIRRHLATPQSISDRLWAKFFIFHKLAFRIADSRYFHAAAGPTAITKHKLNQQLVQLNNECRNRVETILADIPYMSFLTDGWKGCNDLHYYGLVVYGIDNNWNFQRRMLALPEMTSSKSVDLQEVLDAGIEKFKLEPRAIAIATDNAPNVAKLHLSRSKFVIKNMKVQALSNRKRDATGQPTTSEVTFDLFPIHMPCSNHLLNLAFEHAISEDNLVSELLKKAKKLIKHMNNTSAVKEKFFKIQEEEFRKATNSTKPTKQGQKLPKSKRLLMPAETRWLSWCFCVKRLCDLKTAIDSAATEISTRVWLRKKKDKPPLDVRLQIKDWQLLKELNQVAELLIRFSNLLQSNLCIISRFLAALKTLQLELTGGNWEHISAFVGRLRSNIDQYFDPFLKKNSPQRAIAAMAQLLDPNPLRKDLELDGQETLLMERLILKLAKQLSDRNYSQSKSQRNSQTKTPPTDATQNASPAPSPAAKKELALLAFLRPVEQESSTTVIPVKDELSKFRREELTFPILEFWKTYSSSYPQLSRVAKLLFSVPISTAQIERVFIYFPFADLKFFQKT